MFSIMFMRVLQQIMRVAKSSPSSPPRSPDRRSAGIMTSYQRAAQERIEAKRLKDIELQKMRQREEEEKEQQRAAEMARKAELLKAKTEERLAKFYQELQYVFVPLMCI